jgi:hypothetical protein
MTAPIAPWDRLYSDIKIQIPGVLDAVQAQVTFSLFKDFCDKTNIWWEDIPVPVVPDVLTYNFVPTPPNKGAINRLLLLYDPTVNDPDKKWVQSGVSMLVPGTIVLAHAPSTAVTWHAIVAKTPLDPVDTQGYPDIDAEFKWVLDKYREALTYGILARLQMMPGKPYTNAQMSNFNNRNYVSERGKARTDALKANVFGGQRWQFPQGFATVRRGGWA